MISKCQLHDLLCNLSGKAKMGGKIMSGTVWYSNLIWTSYGYITFWIWKSIWLSKLNKASIWLYLYMVLWWKVDVLLQRFAMLKEFFKRQEFKANPTKSEVACFLFIIIYVYFINVALTCDCGMSFSVRVCISLGVYVFLRLHTTCS